MRHLPLLSLLLVCSCAPSRHVTTTATIVHDTLHVTVHDTLHVTQLHDSIVYHSVERTREEETVTYDPSTGNPLTLHKVRETDIDIQSMIRHIIDSIDAASKADIVSAHGSDDCMADEAESGDASLTPSQIAAKRIATAISILFVVFLIAVAIRMYRYGSGSCR